METLKPQQNKYQELCTMTSHVLSKERTDRVHQVSGTADLAQSAKGL